MKWAGHVAGMGERRGAYRVLVMEPDVKRTLRRPRDRWEDNIKMDLREVGWGYRLNWSGSGQGQVADSCECGNDPPALSVSFFTSSGPVTSAARSQTGLFDVQVTVYRDKFL